MRKLPHSPLPRSPPPWPTPKTPNLTPAFRNWAATPPLGRNSWDYYDPTVTEAETRATDDYMARCGSMGPCSTGCRLAGRAG